MAFLVAFLSSLLLIVFSGFIKEQKFLLQENKALPEKLVEGGVESPLIYSDSTFSVSESMPFNAVIPDGVVSVTGVSVRIGSSCGYSVERLRKAKILYYYQKRENLLNEAFSWSGRNKEKIKNQILSNGKSKLVYLLREIII